MKKYKRLLSFGCSFTEGGGLNSNKFHDWLKFGTSLPDDDVLGPNLTKLPEHIEYARQHSYPGYLSRKLGCDFVNFGSSGTSNESIFQHAYREITKAEDPEHTLVTIQSSLFNRIQLQVPELELVVELNRLDDFPSRFHPNNPELGDDVHQFYKLYLSNFYDTRAEYEKLRQRVDTMGAYAKSKGVDMLFIPYMDPGYEPTIGYSGRVDLKHPNQDLMTISNEGKMNIWNYTEGRYKDIHFSPLGNSHIANLIYSHLENDLQ